MYVLRVENHYIYGAERTESAEVSDTDLVVAEPIYTDVCRALDAGHKVRYVNGDIEIEPNLDHYIDRYKQKPFVYTSINGIRVTDSEIGVLHAAASLQQGVVMRTADGIAEVRAQDVIVLLSEVAESRNEWQRFVFATCKKAEKCVTEREILTLLAEAAREAEERGWSEA